MIDSFVMKNRTLVQDALLGVAIGDALGVPVEFIPRSVRDTDPVTGMREMGSHKQLAGTWSDDTSLTLCLAEMLCGPYSLTALAGYFINWKEHGFNTAHGYVFDIGIATSAAIHNLYSGYDPILAGGTNENSNGNGSLMRILPLVFFIKDKPIEQRFRITQEVSSLTHRHIRSVVACFIYLEYARLLIGGNDKMTAYGLMKKNVLSFLSESDVCPYEELTKFHRILEINVGNYDLFRLCDATVDEIYSSGYVINTLEASLWCLLHSNSFSEAVLKAVNLGEDTDTTGAVTGGLAGLLYGTTDIPTDWLEVLAKRNEIEDLATRMTQQLTH
jgi:ADP-ribosylglycohydrolase